jgi:hypothetical protein
MDKYFFPLYFCFERRILGLDVTDLAFNQSQAIDKRNQLDMAICYWFGFLHFLFYRR